jgi:hypothetical protein
MKTRALATIAIVLVAGFGTGNTMPDPASPVITISGADSDEMSHVEWALARLQMAGMKLPSLEIAFHDDFESCGMHEGLLRITSSEVIVHECARDAAVVQRSLLHELTHAWDDLSGELDDQARTAFLESRGLEAWADPESGWPHRGIEHAAEIAAWGLMERPAPIPTRVGDVGPQDEASLRIAFIELTGAVPLWEVQPHDVGG